jgi:hypothetical protein
VNKVKVFCHFNWLERSESSNRQTGEPIKSMERSDSETLVTCDFSSLWSLPVLVSDQKWQISAPAKAAAILPPEA